jgi:hypothetical protein
MAFVCHRLICFVNAHCVSLPNGLKTKRRLSNGQYSFQSSALFPQLGIGSKLNPWNIEHVTISLNA